MDAQKKQLSPAARLRKLLQQETLLLMPCCYDALSAQLIERAGFPLTFMSGFAVSATRLGLPDTGLISYAEMLDQGRNICASVTIPVIGDADTGYGNAINVKRTIGGYAQAGFACAMIEDQVAPKRCGHTHGKQVVDWKEAQSRIQAALDARDEGADILILARTDARATLGLDEAIRRAHSFSEMGADILFLEAPESEEEMQRFCTEVPGFKMANILPQGKTPLLRPQRLKEIGFTLAAYPLTLLNASILAMQDALQQLASQESPHPAPFDFDELKDIVGFNWYGAEEDRYRKEE